MGNPDIPNPCVIGTVSELIHCNYFISQYSVIDCGHIILINRLCGKAHYLPYRLPVLIERPGNFLTENHLRVGGILNGNGHFIQYFVAYGYTASLADDIAVFHRSGSAMLYFICPGIIRYVI